MIADKNVYCVNTTASVNIAVVSQHNGGPQKHLNENSLWRNGEAQDVSAACQMPASANSKSPPELSKFARQRSRSACRSPFGEYAVDGSDSHGVEVVPGSQWPDLKAVVPIAFAMEKGVSSAAGLSNGSMPFTHRFRNIVPTRIEFHVVFLDTTSAILYLYFVSRAAICAVDAFNRVEGRTVGACTFDAGPDAVLYYTENYEGKVLAFLGLLPKEYSKFKPVGHDKRPIDALKHGVSTVYFTRVGDRRTSTNDTLIRHGGLSSKMLESFLS
ncbi:hypothetical protein HOY80DRAFT_1010433 [Tuber brumale]|nr:hypothetical protein HOY80DRAFT_1010433 [Tuber brumale]